MYHAPFFQKSRSWRICTRLYRHQVPQRSLGQLYITVTNIPPLSSVFLSCAFSSFLYFFFHYHLPTFPFCPVIVWIRFSIFYPAVVKAVAGDTNTKRYFWCFRTFIASSSPYALRLLRSLAVLRADDRSFTLGASFGTSFFMLGLFCDKSEAEAFNLVKFFTSSTQTQTQTSEAFILRPVGGVNHPDSVLAKVGKLLAKKALW